MDRSPAVGICLRPFFLCLTCLTVLVPCRQAAAQCKKLSIRDDAYAFKLRVRATSGFFKVNVGTGTTHGECPDYRVNYVGQRVLSGDAARYESIRDEACFVTGSNGDEQEITVEWDVVVPFVPDTLEFKVWCGGSGEVEVSITDFNGQTHINRVFGQDGSIFVPRDQLPAPGGLQSVLPPKPALGPKMGAYLFPWYGTEEGPTGAVRHWDAGDFLYHPVIGNYDSGDPQVIDQQMAWAREAGFNLFVLSYWDNEYSNTNTPPILNPAQKALIEISAMVETVARRTGERRETLRAQIQEILDAYGNHPAWLRAEGKPVIFFYDRVNDELEEVSGAAWWDDWVWVKVQLTPEPILMIPVTGSTTPAQIEAMGGGTVFAANSGSGNPWTGSAQDDWGWTWKTYLAGGLSSLPILPSFKEVRTIENDISFRNQWRFARNSMPDIILINSWNEYHESTIVEPTVEFGKRYLEMSAVETDLFCRGELGEMADAASPVSREHDIETTRLEYVNNIVQVDGTGQFELQILHLSGKTVLRKDFKNSISQPLDGRFPAGVYIIILKGEPNRYLAKRILY